MKPDQLKELLLQVLEHERCGVKVYEAALQSAITPGLRADFEKYLAQTLVHERVVLGVLEGMKLDPTERTAGVEVIHHLGEALVVAMEGAREAGPPAAAERVACECVLQAETRDQLNWQLVARCASAVTEPTAALLKDAVGQVREEEDEHLARSRGWCRELWADSLGLSANLPLPEDSDAVRRKPFH